MAKDRILFLLSLGFLGFLAAFLFRGGSTPERQLPVKIEQEQTGESVGKAPVDVLVAKQPLKAGDLLAPDKYSWQKQDRASVDPSLAIVKNDEVENALKEAKLSKDISSGELIKKSDVIWPYEIETTEILPALPGKRIVLLELPKKSAISRFLKPDMKVDVVFTSKSEIGFGSVSITLLKDIRILAVHRTIAAKAPAAQGVESADVLLEMSPKQSEILSYAEQAGNISLEIVQQGPSSNGQNQLAEMLLTADSSGNFNSVLVTYMIRSLFPGQDIHITVTPKGYVASGKLKDAKIAEKIIETLQKLAPDGAKSIVDLIEIDIPVIEEEQPSDPAGPSSIESLPENAPIEVMKALKALKPGENLQQQAYEWEKADPETLDPSLVIKTPQLEKWIGKAIVSKEISAGEKIKRLDIVFPDEVKKKKKPETLPPNPGKRAVAFEISPTLPILSFLKPGRDVDIVFTSKPDVGFGSISVTLLKNLRILAIETDADGKNYRTPPKDPVKIFLEMTGKQAEIFSYAKEAGILSIELVEQGPSSEAQDHLAEMLQNTDSPGNFNSILVTYLIRSLFPDAQVNITATPKGYIASGKVKNYDAAEKIIEVLQKLAPDGAKAVVDLLEITARLAETAEQEKIEALGKEKELEILIAASGKRAVPFELSGGAAIAQFLRPRMFVDITFTSKGDIGFGSVSVTLLKNLRVLAVGKPGEKEPSKEGSKEAFAKGGVEILLEMTQKQAEILSYAQHAGAVTLQIAQQSPVSTVKSKLVEMLLNTDSAGNFNSVLVTYMMRTLFPDVDVNITTTPKGYIASGKVKDQKVADKIMEILQKLAADGEKSIVNLMGLDPQLVLISVKVFEVSKDITGRVGINWEALFSHAGESIALSAVFPRPPLTDPNYFINAQGLQFGNWTLSAIVDMLQSDGCARVLAEPNLTTTSGKTANFFAGGEFPILIPQGGSLLGTVTVEYKKYGVILEFTPTVDLNGLISLHVRPEISTIDRANSVILAGFEIPGLIVRRAETTVKLWSGQTYAIAGMLSYEISGTNDHLYGLNELPVIGPLFNSQRYRNQQTELMIIITPYLLYSENPCDRPPPPPPCVEYEPIASQTPECGDWPVQDSDPQAINGGVYTKWEEPAKPGPCNSPTCTSCRPAASAYWEEQPPGQFYYYQPQEEIRPYIYNEWEKPACGQ